MSGKCKNDMLRKIFRLCLKLLRIYQGGITVRTAKPEDKPIKVQVHDRMKGPLSEGKIPLSEMIVPPDNDCYDCLKQNKVKFGEICPIEVMLSAPSNCPLLQEQNKEKTKDDGSTSDDGP